MAYIERLGAGGTDAGSTCSRGPGGREEAGREEGGRLRFVLCVTRGILGEAALVFGMFRTRGATSGEDKGVALDGTLVGLCVVGLFDETLFAE